MQVSAIELDATDRRLLEQLQSDASLTNQALAEAAHTSPATALRRVRRLVDTGVIDRQVALLNCEGHGPHAHVLLARRITFDMTEHLDAFEQRIAADDEVQQLWRVSPGPDFVLVVHCADMPGYHALAQRLFTQDANVRNVKAFFAVKRAKFVPRLKLPASGR